MNHLKFESRAALLLTSALLVLASCESEKKPDPSAVIEGQTITNIEPGVAGGSSETTFTSSATVNSVDKSARTITLTTENGTKATFPVGSGVRNFDQFRAGDKINATLTERLVVFVRSSGSDPRITHAAALEMAPAGAKPGVIVAERYEIIASIKSIDSVNRTATLQFANNQVRTVAVRPDVDLSRYSPGETVVIRVSATLAVLVEKP